MIQVFYNGVDVTSNVSINRCYHDMYAEGQSDSLTMRFNDTNDRWDRWSPKIGDEIKVVYGAISTGTMFVSEIIPTNGLHAFKALSAPQSAFVRRYKAWEFVSLPMIAEEIAKRHGLLFENRWSAGYVYKYILQGNESDFSFLHKRCVLEGCAFLVYDKKLVIYQQSAMERQKPLETVTFSKATDYQYNDRSRYLYGSCLVEKGEYKGKHIADATNPCVLLPQFDAAVGSNADATRFAQGLLREANKGARTGFIRGQIMPQYAAASVLNIVNDRAPSWDGSVFLTHIRNNYADGTSKMFFRKPLEGY